MKRANFILTMTASALTLFAPQSISASEATAPVHAQANSNQQSSDTLVYSATKSLIESFGELSKTASKLSETALKLLESQEGNINNGSPKSTEKKAATTPRQQHHASEAIEELPSEPLRTVPSPEYLPAPQLTSHETIVVTDTVYMTVTDTIHSSVWMMPEEREGGKYLWIPDQNMSAVESVLNGTSPFNSISTLSAPQSAVDLNEMVFWRGDSIPMAIPTKRLGRYDRKLYNWLIYPKGLWHIGLTANYGELNTEDSEFLSLIQDVDLKGKIYSIKPSISYFLRNNICVGLRLAFTKGEMGINSFKVDIDEDMSFDLHDIKYSSDSYAAAVFIQQYFGLSRRGRFAVFNEAEVSVGTGSSHFIRPFDGELRDTRTKTQTFNINYSPGVSIMMMKNAAFNLSFGIFGFHLKDEKQWENGEESGSRFTSGINFRFNLFNINFGVSIII